MNIYVCVKHVPDSAATITIEGKNAINEKITFLVNPYDEHAITEAVRLKNAQPGTEVIAVCLGKPSAENTLRSAMAMGADRGILIETDRFHDSIFTARALADAIKADGSPWLIFTGKEAIDSEGMQTQFRLAGNLRLPVATKLRHARSFTSVSAPCFISSRRRRSVSKHLRPWQRLRIGSRSPFRRSRSYEVCDPRASYGRCWRRN